MVPFLLEAAGFELSAGVLDFDLHLMRGWLQGDGAICFWLKNCNIFS